MIYYLFFNGFSFEKAFIIFIFFSLRIFPDKFLCDVLIWMCHSNFDNEKNLFDEIQNYYQIVLFLDLFEECIFIFSFFYFQQGFFQIIFVK
jgi:hypothetical protein